VSLVSRSLAALLCAGLAAIPAFAQQPAFAASGSSSATSGEATTAPPIRREFRGAWVASVSNIDWPSRPGLSTAEQQSELLDILDRAAQVGLNAVILQVRPAADALYPSKYEPWSEYLTGEMGRAPEPLWDPLAFAVQEAHARGLELHAWFNPYRARNTDGESPAARSHISRTHPELVRRYGKYLWMDPGEPAVQAHSLRVILDVVRRYDIDGVHIDDYFYPYREPSRRGGYIPFPDDRSWRRYRRAGGTLARDDWRRRNVDTFVRRLYDAIKDEKPWVKFGVSPFGIWRPGHPAEVRGLDAYEQLFADSRKWLANGWLDYFAPQLYWPIDAPAQSYPALLEWWVGENAKGRHVWPGNYTSRSAGLATPNWPASELVEQVRLTRAQAGATGNVHFSMTALMPRAVAPPPLDLAAVMPTTFWPADGEADGDSVASIGAVPPSPVSAAPAAPMPLTLGEQLHLDVYGEPALVPASPWLDRGQPARPTAVVARDSTTGGLVLRIEPGDRRVVRRWTVRSRGDRGWTAIVLPAEQRIRALTSSAAELGPEEVVVTAIDRFGNESAVTVVHPRAIVDEARR
jgi:uncharacterized lipoprotein YddW (UPF0748 family)